MRFHRPKRWQLGSISEHPPKYIRNGCRTSIVRSIGFCSLLCDASRKMQHDVRCKHQTWEIAVQQSVFVFFSMSQIWVQTERKTGVMACARTSSELRHYVSTVSTAKGKRCLVRIFCVARCSKNSCSTSHLGSCGSCNCKHRAWVNTKLGSNLPEMVDGCWWENISSNWWLKINSRVFN